MMRNARLWLVIAVVVALATMCAGWKWTVSSHRSSGIQLAGWSWDGAASFDSE
jgi:hypothetical protein